MYSSHAHALTHTHPHHTRTRTAYLFGIVLGEPSLQNAPGLRTLRQPGFQLFLDVTHSLTSPFFNGPGLYHVRFT